MARRRGGSFAPRRSFRVTALLMYKPSSHGPSLLCRSPPRRDSKHWAENLITESFGQKGQRALETPPGARYLSTQARGKNLLGRNWMWSLKNSRSRFFEGRRFGSVVCLWKKSKQRDKCFPFPQPNKQSHQHQQLYYFSSERRMGLNIHLRFGIGISQRLLLNWDLNLLWS